MNPDTCYSNALVAYEGGEAGGLQRLCVCQISVNLRAIETESYSVQAGDRFFCQHERTVRGQAWTLLLAAGD
jgi:hypothetical protein